MLIGRLRRDSENLLAEGLVVVGEVEQVRSCVVIMVYRVCQEFGLSSLGFRLRVVGPLRLLQVGVELRRVSLLFRHHLVLLRQPFLEDEVVQLVNHAIVFVTEKFLNCAYSFVVADFCV